MTQDIPAPTLDAFKAAFRQNAGAGPTVQDGVALLQVHLRLIEGCQHTDDLADLVDVRDRTVNAIRTCKQLITTSPVVRSNAVQVKAALEPLQRLIDRMAQDAPQQGNQAQAAPEPQAAPAALPAYAPPPGIRQEVPDTWDGDRLEVNEMFGTLLGVHAEHFDGARPTNLPGITYAVMDKRALAAEYVKASMWNEAEYGPFDISKPDCRDAVDAVVDGMCPDAMTMPPAVNGDRTILIQKERYEDGGQPDYDAANAVMMHESHHASSVGFVNTPFFNGDQGKSWKFDECVTEYFTKKAWDAKYPDKKDTYFQGSNYFKNQGSKQGWYGEATKEMLQKGLFNEGTLAKAYFAGNDVALAELQGKSNEIGAVVAKHT